MRIAPRHIAFLLGWLAALYLPAQAQQAYPKGYFRSPLDIPLKLSGTFGELRTNHFHSGLDIRTNSVEGLNIYAAADGFVSRVKVSAYGYGLALYVDHPNGYTTVYAHLQQFQGPIADWVYKKHYEKESFELDITLYPNELPVKKGQVMALSGNSGGSGGPHLHFEIRDTKTEEILNPQLFGFQVADKVAPAFAFVELVPHGPGSQINGSGNVKKLWVQRDKAGNSFLTKQQLRMWGGFYVQTRVSDKHDGNGFNNGIYRLLLLDGKDTLYQFQADAFAFSETRYANTVMDYKQKMLKREQIYRLMRAPGNKSTVVAKLNSDGIIQLAPGEKKTLLLVATDFAGNSSRLELEVSGAESRTAELLATPQPTERYTPDKPLNIIKEDLRVSMPAWNFYDTLDLIYRRSIKPFVAFSAVHTLHTADEPIHGFYTISIKQNGLPDSLRAKTVMVNVGINNSRNATAGSWKADFFEAKVRSFGDFYLSIDTVAPVVRALNFKPGANYRAGQYLNFKLSDNLVGLASYQVYIDGQWEYHYFDGKTATLQLPLQKKLASGNHLLEIVVKDGVGNITRYQANFNLL